MKTQHSDRAALSHTLRLAFRATFLSRFDALLASHQDKTATGVAQDVFLGQLPIFRGCAIQIELEVLFRTWQTVSQNGMDGLGDLDQCVCYCALGLLAKVSERRDAAMLARASDRTATSGPLDCVWLTSQLRTLQMVWPVWQDESPILSQEMLSEARLDKETEGTSTDDPSRSAALAILGRWQVSFSIFANAADLLTSSEMHRLRGFFAQHPRLINV